MIYWWQQLDDARLLCAERMDKQIGGVTKSSDAANY